MTDTAPLSAGGGVATGAGPSGSARVRSKVRRAGLAVGCLIYAAAALGMGLDRQATDKAGPATEVLALFAREALQARAWLALAAGDWADAARQGEALVSRDPFNPAAPALLGAARASLGDAEGAEAAYRVARQMGWRDDLTQRYWRDRALERGDYITASAHVDALLRQRPDLLSDRDLLDPLERSDQGQQALATRLVARPDWLIFYMADVWDTPRDILLIRAAVLGRAARLGVVGGCEPAGKIAFRLAQFGEAAVASRLWHEHCPAAGTGLVTDGNFAGATFSPTISPFDWQFVSNSDVDTAFAPAPKDGNGGVGQWLTISTSAPFTRIVASQFIIVPAGAYRLSWASRGHTGADTPMVQASLDCAMNSDNWLPATLDSRSQRWQAEVTLGDSCAGKWLNFAVRPGVTAGAGVRGGDVSLGAVRLEPLAKP